MLDLAIADRLPGGFAGGRISHVIGPESTAKTVMAQEPLGSAQRQGGEVWLDDSEGTFDATRAGLFGLDVESRFCYLRSKNIEELFDVVLAGVLKDRKPDSPPGAMAIDSLSALPSATELEQGLSDTGYGTTRAKQLSAAFRKYIWPLNQTNLALIFIDQTRMDIGSAFKKYTTSGGKALSFYASTRILLEHRKKIVNPNKKVVGVKIHFIVAKNKIAPPFREGTFIVMFDMGIDDVATNLDWLRINLPKKKEKKEESEKEGEENEKGDEKEKGVWYSFKEDKYGPGLMRAAEAIEADDLEEELRQEVYRVWQEVYATPRRKQRKRQ